MKMSPRLMKFLLNIYPPYLGAGVRVTHVAADWHRLDVEMRLRFYNRNYVGTHFGGSLYSMVDPHVMLLLIQLLGRDYIVWDREATVEFIRPGRGTVRSSIEIDDAMLDDIRRHTASGERYLPEFRITIRDDEEEVVARVTKQLYVRRKARKKPAAKPPRAWRPA